MAQISVVIATKDEEDNIKDCLESIKWADEIIIVDDMSKDRTVEICKDYTSNIILNESKGSFHINKNLGIDRSNGVWILSIDADERGTPELEPEIRHLIDKTEKLGFFINRKNYFLGKWIRGCGWYPDYIVRLFRKGATQWPLEIHDVPNIKDKNKVGYLKSPLIHISYTTLEQYFDKFARYSTRLAQEEHEKGTRITKTSFLLLFLVKPLAWFFNKYILLRGYKDGFRGFFISVSSALTIFMTYAKLWEMQQKPGISSKSRY
jgi:glycosyltransferase involved in cell wall biosynthesis